MRNVWDKCAILLAKGVPVIAVHVLRVEEIAVTAPYFVEHLGPLLLRHAIHQKVGG